MKDLAQKMIEALRAGADDLAERCRDAELDVEALSERLSAIDSSASLADFFPEEVEPHYMGSAQAAIVARLLRDAGFRCETPRLLEGDQQIDERTIVAGDLVVQGHLQVEAQLVVMGDLVVRSYGDEYGVTSVAGELRAEQGVYTMGFVSVAGMVRTPFLCLDFNQGFAKLYGGCSTRVLIESDHGGSRIFGGIDAEFVTYDELQADEEPTSGTPDALFAMLHDDVHEAAKATLSEEGDGFDHNLGPNLWEQLREGKPLFRDA
jgi:hypothetical protein